MNKEEILEKSRKEKSDEGLIAAENQGRKIGIGVFCGVFVFIILFNFFYGQPNYAPMGMFWAFLAAEAYPKYKFTQRKGYLLIVVAGAIACIASLGSFIITTLR